MAAAVLQPRYNHSVALDPQDRGIVEENVALMGPKTTKADMFRAALHCLNEKLKKETSL